jgi:hypothetical protein
MVDWSTSEPRTFAAVVALCRADGSTILESMMRFRARIPIICSYSLLLDLEAELPFDGLSRPRIRTWLTE